VVKVDIHLQNIDDFARMDAIYERFFAEPRPARTTAQSVLMAGISVEIDAVVEDFIAFVREFTQWQLPSALGPAEEPR
jgi:hypothetical protein